MKQNKTKIIYNFMQHDWLCNNRPLSAKNDQDKLYKITEKKHTCGK